MTLRALAPTATLILLSLALAAGHPAEASAPVGQRIASVAMHYLLEKPRLAVRACTGLVQAVLADSGRQIRGSVADQWRELDGEGRTHWNPTPEPGDLAFFDRTYDRNGNGRVDDPLTHVAIVVSVDEEGTIKMVHYGQGTISTLWMNLNYANLRTLDGKPLNSPVAKPGYGRPDQQLTGQLWHGFATIN